MELGIEIRRVQHDRSYTQRLTPFLKPHCAPLRKSPCLRLQGSPTDSDESYAPQDAAMDVRDKVVRAVKTDTPRNKATSLSSVRTKRAHKLSDDIRDKVLKAVEGGMSCRQAAAHCGVSLASAIRWTKHFRT